MNPFRQGIARCSVAALGLMLGCAMPALAQETKAISATPTKCPDQIAAIAACYEDRDANGAFVLAALPKNWNGILIVFAHGGPALVPPASGYSQAGLANNAFAVRQGFGWVASSYRREGYGVRMAATDTDLARRYFIEHIAKPRLTVLHGASYGGIVAAKVLETYANDDGQPRAYDGAMMNSPLLAGATLGYEFRVDLRAVYQYYCKNLPTPDEPQYPLWMGVAPGSKMTLDDLDKKVNECTGVSAPADKRTEQQKRNLANILGVIKVPENLLIRHMQSSTLLFGGIATSITSGRNPFSNIGVRYRGSEDDERLNREVARFAADPSAVADLKWDGEALGIVRIPTITTHSINDPQVAVEQESIYRDAVTAAGNASRLVQTYTDEAAHTGQSARELSAVLDSLLLWIQEGKKPTAQTIAAKCSTYTFEGACRYHPEFEPKPYNTKFYTREGLARP